MSCNCIGGYYANGFHPTPEGPEAIAEAIRVTTSVTSIDVGYNSIGQAASLELLAAMRGKKMVTIGMANCNLGVKGSKVVAEMISDMTSITSINLASNEIGGYYPPAPFRLRADKYIVTPEGPQAIANAIHVSRSLTSIDLSENCICSEGAKALAPALQHNISLTLINLCDNKLGPEGAKTLAPVIRDVICLDVRYNSITGDGASQFLAAVLGNLKMEQFNEISIADMRTNSCTTLDLSGRSFGVVGSMVVACLPFIPSLISIDLSGNSLDPECAKALAPLLRGSSLTSV